MTRVYQLLNSKKLKPHTFEKFLNKTWSKSALNKDILQDCVFIRRSRYGILNDRYSKTLPYHDYNYRSTLNKNCENVIGFTRIPTGAIGPIKWNEDEENIVPFATTEGALVSSINRGVKLINNSNFQITVEDVGMTRSPIIECTSIEEVQMLKEWITNNFDNLREIFEMESNHTKLKEITFLQEGRHLHIRFRATTGEAMGMNMVGKGSNFVLRYLKKQFDNIKVISLSGNTCTDKKSNAINWITGRGKHVVMEAEIDPEQLSKILRVGIDEMVDINLNKNMIGSSLAGTMGGNNCNTSNIVAGIFLATGQDAGQIGTSSFSILNLVKKNNMLLATLTMPCLEIGTIGGGTTLDDQKFNISLICGEKENKVEQLAKNIIYCVLGCELSLLSSLCNNDLMYTHLKLNRGK